MVGIGFVLKFMRRIGSSRHPRLDVVEQLRLEHIIIDTGNAALFGIGHGDRMFLSTWNRIVIAWVWTLITPIEQLRVSG